MSALEREGRAGKRDCSGMILPRRYLYTDLDSLLQPTLTSRAGAGGLQGPLTQPWVSWRDHNPSGHLFQAPFVISLAANKQTNKQIFGSSLCLLLLVLSLGSTGKSLAPSLPLGRCTKGTPEDSSSCSTGSSPFGVALTLSWAPGVTPFLLQEAPAWPGCSIHSSPHFVEGRAPHLPPSSPARALLSTWIHGEGMSPPSLTQCHH